MKQLKATLFLLLSALMILSAGPSFAEDVDRYTSVTIIPERTALSPGEELSILTSISLDPHWHVYWKNPGDSGLPVKITWDMPDGFEIGEIEWPAPDKISYDILVNYGYYNQANLLQKLKIPAVLPEGTITLTAKLELLVCNEICIPETDTISIELNNPDNLTTDNSETIQTAQENITEPIKGQFEYKEIENILHLTLTPEDRTILGNANSDNLEFFPYDWGIIDHVAMPEATIQDGTITIKHARGDQSLDEIEDIKGLLVIKGNIGENKGFEITASSPKKKQSPTLNINQPNTLQSQENTNVQSNNVHISTTWYSALYLALLGGLILNLMPCVFPVLSMKALSLVKVGEKENKIARLHGLAYTIGIILSFLIVGGTLILLKEAGTAIGWGFQLQNPMIVALLAYLLFAIGLNLVGFFDFDFGLGNIGQKLTSGHSISSSFFTGVLATIVATPCTAPFMGAAMGFALTQPPAISLSVFAMIGLGLALPYLALCFIPITRKILPKPGLWMVTFKQFLAFPMLASAIWLVWVLSQQSGSYGVLLVLLGMLSISFGVWLSHLKKAGIKNLMLQIGIILALLPPILSLSYIKTIVPITSAPTESEENFGIPFSQTELSNLLKEDQPIFVEMTAAWCITCKLNHAIAINTASTKALFKEKNITFIVGDWTNYNEEITNYLNSFDRNGVPLYVYYGPRDKITGIRPEPKILPQVLTTKIVKDNIGQ